MFNIQVGVGELSVFIKNMLVSSFMCNVLGIEPTSSIKWATYF